MDSQQKEPLLEGVIFVIFVIAVGFCILGLAVFVVRVAAYMQYP